MKKNRKKSRYSFDIETLKRWKKTSAKSKLDWLTDALEFFGKPKIK